MTVSVILPTIRPAAWRRAAASVPAAAADISYELIVVADFLPEGRLKATTWIERARAGVVDAVVAGMARASGDYVFLLNDESLLDPGAIAALVAAAEAEPGGLWSPQHDPPFPFVYFGRPFAPFPFAHRSLIASLGGLLDPVYRAFYADPDLSLRAHAAGVPVRVLEHAVIHHDNRHDGCHAANVAAYLDGDRRTFTARWQHLGPVVDP